MPWFVLETVTPETEYAQGLSVVEMKLKFFYLKDEGRVWLRYGSRRQREGEWWGREEGGVGRVTCAALLLHGI